MAAGTGAGIFLAKTSPTVFGGGKPAAGVLASVGAIFMAAKTAAKTIMIAMKKYFFML